MVSRVSKIWKLSHPRMRVRATPWTCCKTILNFMIGRTKPRIRDRQPKIKLKFTRGWQWLPACAIVCAAAAAGQAPPAPRAAPPPPPAPSKDAPDDEFIEFLGTDDVGDAAWWEFLKKVPPRSGNPPAAPPQDVKQ